MTWGQHHATKPAQTTDFDNSFGGVRVKNYKLMFTAKDTWLGPNLPLTSAPAVYNLLWDQVEQYDITLNRAAPTRGDLRTSPGRFSGPDHGWTLGGYMIPNLFHHFLEAAKDPHKPSLIKGRLFFQIPPENRPY
jgi:arylsulfatase